MKVQKVLKLSTSAKILRPNKYTNTYVNLSRLYHLYQDITSHIIYVPVLILIA